MITVEWHEGRELHPAVAQFLVSIAIEATGISADERNLEYLELQNALNVEVHVLPFAVVVAQPVSCPLAGASESRTTDHEGPLARINRVKSQVCGLLLHQAPEIMGVQFSVTAGVSGISSEGMDR